MPPSPTMGGPDAQAFAESIHAATLEPWQGGEPTSSTPSEGTVNRSGVTPGAGECLTLESLRARDDTAAA